MTDRRDLTCCFTGHRHIPAEKLTTVIDKLNVELGWLVSHGITDYYAGGALGFDTLAALAVLREKKLNGHLRLHLALPCPEQTKFWKPRDIEIYNYILEQADSVSYASQRYHKGAMQLRNRYMVDHSRYCICYYDDSIASEGHGAGTRNTVSHARATGVTVINLMDEPPDDGQIEFDCSM